MAVEYTRVTVVILSVLLLGWGTFANFPYANAVEIIDADIAGKIEIFVRTEDGIAYVKIKQDGITTDYEFTPAHPSAVLGKINGITGIGTSDINSEWRFEAINDDGTIEIFVRADYSISHIKIKQDGELTEFELDTSKRNTIQNEITKLTGLELNTIDFDWKFEMKIAPHERKISVCHIPPGNTSNAHKVRISQNALEYHLAHGDLLGKCPDDDADEQRKKIEKEKNTKKIKLKKIQKELKNEIKKLRDLNKDFIDKAEFKKALKEKKEEIKELLKELKENYAYDKELKKELKKDLKITKHKIIQDLKKHEKITKHKVDSKISILFFGCHQDQ